LQLVQRRRGSQVVTCNMIIVTQLHVLIMKQCTYVTDTSHELVESLRSALREACLENEKLQLVLEGKCNELERVSVERDKLEVEIAELQATYLVRNFSRGRGAIKGRGT